MPFSGLVVRGVVLGLGRVCTRARRCRGMWDQKRKSYNCILKIIYAENISGSYITNQLDEGLLTAYPLAEFTFFTRLCIIMGSGGWDVSPTVCWMKAEWPPPRESAPSQP